MTDPSSLWGIFLPVTAISLAANAYIITSYTSAYFAAPQEIHIFIDTIDFSIQENESYDSDVSKLQRLEDKVRLGRLLRDIQKAGDDLREDVNRLVIAEGSNTLRPGARILWAAHRRQLEERVRRIDMLRMRFLTVYMGVVTKTAGEQIKHAEKVMPKEPATPVYEAPRGFPKGLTDSIKNRPPLRRVSTQSITLGHHAETPHRMGWKHVVQELQRSPMMHRRHASIEQSMRSPPAMSPLGSPLALTPQMDNGRFVEAIETIPEHKI
ncbi:hypothetical protein F5Y06DRAFT_288374 [Hypoxylon sp. FL0890]|nr:hypothetical protein F5Y06DRAFT_288374 [Hypoxylon sp. FL0890]